MFPPLFWFNRQRKYRSFKGFIVFFINFAYIMYIWIPDRFNAIYNNFLQQKNFVNSHHAKKCVKTLALPISLTQIWYCDEFNHYAFNI